MARTKVKMLIAIAGHAEPKYDLADFAFDPGQVVDIDSKLALLWIASGTAEAWLEIETASIEPRNETAILPPGSPKKPKGKS
jgi:hypothetical protein